MAPLSETTTTTTTMEEEEILDYGLGHAEGDGVAVAASRKRGAAAAAASWNPMSLTWSEKYSHDFERAWARVPSALQKVLVTLAVFVVGLAMSGDWIVILVHLRRQLGLDPAPEASSEVTSATWSEALTNFASTHFKDFGFFWITANAVSYVLYFGIGGFLHWYFYVRQRASAKEWKCQPNGWITPEEELHEIKVGSLSMLVPGTLSAMLSCYIYNGGWSTVYYDWGEYGLAWLLLQVPAIFIYQDYATFWLHRMYHVYPWLYKNFHKMHHKYKHPTAFSVTAIHPVEMLHIQMVACLPLFIVPVHWVSYYTVAMYVYYHGIIDHSGINFKAHWWQPWQPDVLFHDMHHQSPYVNYGFNTFLWDKIHGTYSMVPRGKGWHLRSK